MADEHLKNNHLETQNALPTDWLESTLESLSGIWGIEDKATAHLTKSYLETQDAQTADWLESTLKGLPEELNVANVVRFEPTAVAFESQGEITDLAALLAQELMKAFGKDARVVWTRNLRNELQKSVALVGGKVKRAKGESALKMVERGARENNAHLVKKGALSGALIRRGGAAHALQIACMRGNLEALNALLEDSTLNIDDLNLGGTTPFVLAEMKGHYACLRALANACIKADESGERLAAKQAKRGEGSDDIRRESMFYRMLEELAQATGKGAAKFKEVAEGWQAICAETAGYGGAPLFKEQTWPTVLARAFGDAIENRNLEIVAACIDLGASVSSPCPYETLFRLSNLYLDGETPVYKAIKAGWKEGLVFLLDAAQKEPEIAEAMEKLSKASSFDCNDDAYMTLEKLFIGAGEDGGFHAAAKNKNPEILAVMLERFPWFLEDKNLVGVVPVEAAALAGSPESLKLLLDALEDSGPKHWRKQNAVLAYAIKGGNEECVKLALDRKVSLDLGNPLAVAAGKGDTGLLGLILGALPIPGKLAKMRSALLESIKENRQETFHALLDAGALPEFKGDEEERPFKMAVKYDRVQMAKELVGRGAVPTLKMDQIEPWRYAAKMRAFNVALELCRLDGNVSEKTISELQICLAIENNDKAALEAALEGCDLNLNSLPLLGNTLFSWVAACDADECVEELSKRGADVNAWASAFSVPKLGIEAPRGSALMLAAELGFGKCAKALLHAGADAQDVDLSQISPKENLYFVIDGKYMQSVLEGRADPNVEDMEENTPLIYAVEKGDADTVRRLLELGAAYGEDGVPIGPQTKLRLECMLTLDEKLAATAEQLGQLLGIEKEPRPERRPVTGSGKAEERRKNVRVLSRDAVLLCVAADAVASHGTGVLQALLDAAVPPESAKAALFHACDNGRECYEAIPCLLDALKL